MGLNVANDKGSGSDGCVVSHTTLGMNYCAGKEMSPFSQGNSPSQKNTRMKMTPISDADIMPHHALILNRHKVSDSGVTANPSISLNDAPSAQRGIARHGGSFVHQRDKLTTFGLNALHTFFLPLHAAQSADKNIIRLDDIRINAAQHGRIARIILQGTLCIVEEAFEDKLCPVTVAIGSHIAYLPAEAARAYNNQILHCWSEGFTLMRGIHDCVLIENSHENPGGQQSFHRGLEKAPKPETVAMLALLQSADTPQGAKK